MKRIIGILLILLLLLSAASCAGRTEDMTGETVAPATDNATPTETPGEASEIDLTASPEALGALIERYTADGDHYAAYCAALKLSQLSPEETKAYILAAEALLHMAQANVDAINALLNEGAANSADAQNIIAWAENARADFVLSLPFEPDYASEDEINAEGTTAGNLTNAMKVSGEWRGGFVTAQADWIYFARIDENFAIYKMRADGSLLQRVGAARGFSLNVVGDWLYFTNLNDGSKPYKMRTDGSMLQKLADEMCSFLSVSGDWMYYDSGVLYRQNIVSGKKNVLVDQMPMSPCVSGEFVYYMEKSNQGGLWRVSVEGGQPEKILDAMVQAYCIRDGYLYYIGSDHLGAVSRMSLDGSGNETVYQGEEPLTALNFVGDGLYVSAGRYIEDDGVLVGSIIYQVGIGTGEIKSVIDARTEPLCSALGCLFYTEYNEGMAWHGLNPGPEKTIDMVPAETVREEESDTAVIADNSASIVLAPLPEGAADYTVRADALLARCAAIYDEINRLLALGYANAQAGEIATWVTENQTAYAIEVPLLPNEINEVGITAGNLTNAAKFNGWWLGGLLTWQGEWAYLARPDEGFALYRMHADGSAYERMGDAHGSSLNAVGQWLYFINADDGDKPYRMRLNGSDMQKLSDDSCSFLSVSGDSLYYHNGGDNGYLYRVKIDGSGSMKLNDVTAMFACVYGDWVYYQEKTLEGGLYRVPIEGGEKQLVAAGNIRTYCVEGDWVYYIDFNEVYCIWRVHGDGTGKEAYYPCNMTLTGFNFANDMLVLPYNPTYQADGFTVSELIAIVNSASNAEPISYFEDTPLVFTGPDGWTYFMRYGENLAWYAMDREGNLSRIG